MSAADDINDFIDRARNIADLEQANADGFAAQAVAAVDSIHPVTTGISLSYTPGSTLRDVTVPPVPSLTVGAAEFDAIRSEIESSVVTAFTQFFNENFPDSLGTQQTAIKQLTDLADQGITAAKAMGHRLDTNNGFSSFFTLQQKVAASTYASDSYLSERYNGGRAATTFLQSKFPDGGSAAAYLGSLFNAGDAAATQLITMLTSGGTGLSPAVEDAVWQRDRARVLKESARTIKATISGMASRGFPMPTGAMVTMMQMGEADAQDKISEASRDTAIKQIETYIENIRTAAQIAATTGLQAGKTVLEDSTGGGRVMLEDAMAAARLTLEDVREAAKILIEDSLATVTAVLNSASQASAQVVRLRNEAMNESIAYVKLLIDGDSAAAGIAGTLASARASALSAGASYYSAAAQAANGYNSAYAQLESIKLQPIIKQAEITSAQLIENNRALIGIAQARSQAALGAAQAVSNIAAAAMSSLNAIASLTSSG